ncbi:hypothetical protein AAG570_002621 [Ranatra chinensis]|uniref:WIF domain-containing protein n=1 Tax=Ranatra chinensis TaxID=642074 RepID=A0ABD0YA65_9HEMI
MFRCLDGIFSLERLRLNYVWTVDYLRGDAMLAPRMNISSSGLVPKTAEAFRVQFPCTGARSAEIAVSLHLNVTGPGHRPAILLFKRNKICLKGGIPCGKLGALDPLSQSMPFRQAGFTPLDPTVLRFEEHYTGTGTRPTWAYGIELWGFGEKGNIDRIQSFQSIHPGNGTLEFPRNMSLAPESSPVGESSVGSSSAYLAAGLASTLVLVIFVLVGYMRKKKTAAQASTHNTNPDWIGRGVRRLRVSERDGPLDEYVMPHDMVEIGRPPGS